MSQQPSQPKPQRKILHPIIRTCIQSSLLFLLLTTFLGRFVIRQTSMEPTFHEGQRVLVSRIGSFWNDFFIGTAHASGRPTPDIVLFRRGQVAVFYDTPTLTGDPLIKRVIGLPGDTVHIQDGDIYLNGEKQREPYIHGEITSCITSCGPWVLGNDEYFMLGDNRSVSRDSRSFGPIHGGQIIGRVVLKYWPLENFQLLP